MDESPTKRRRRTVVESSSQSPESPNISSDAIEQHEAVPLPAVELSCSLTDSLPPYPEGGIVEELANEQVRMSSIL
jgi:hypothetical protein